MKGDVTQYKKGLNLSCFKKKENKNLILISKIFFLFLHDMLKYTLNWFVVYFETIENRRVIEKKNQQRKFNLI